MHGRFIRKGPIAGTSTILVRREGFAALDSLTLNLLAIKLPLNCSDRRCPPDTCALSGSNPCTGV